MSAQEKGAYLLGTHSEELQRLGFQHQVWSSESREAWRLAGFTQGQTILDLGCGPGFASTELAYLVGQEGKVIGVDKSQIYIEYLENLKNFQKLPIDLQCADFHSMQLSDNSLDGIYHRWALAWVKEPYSIVSKMVKALKPGGVIVSHEYFNWSSLQMEPHSDLWQVAKRSIQKSFKEQEGDIDIGKYLPAYFEKLGLKIISLRPLIKMVRPNDLTWNWPKSFFEIYLPKISKMGYISEQDCNDAISEFERLSGNPNSVLVTPTMIELIARKV